MDSSGRDRGLSRISRLTRWSAVGALGLTGVFSALVAHSRSGSARSTSSGPAAGSTPTTAPSVDNGAGGVLQPPARLPQPGRGSGAVTSGSS